MEEIIELVHELAKSPDTVYGKKAGPESPYGKKQVENAYGKKSAAAESPYGKKSAAAESPYGKKSADAESPYGKKAPDENPYGKKSVTENPYGKKAAAETPYGKKAAVETPYGKKAPTESPYGKKVAENPYGRKKSASEADEPVYSATPTLLVEPDIAEQAAAGQYGRKGDKGIMDAAKGGGYGSKASVIKSESPYGTKLAPAGQLEYGNKDAIDAANASVSSSPPSMLASQSIYGRTMERGNSVGSGQPTVFATESLAYGDVAKGKQDAAEPDEDDEASNQPRAATLAPEQIMAMINAMTSQQQQQALMMLSTAVNKGTQLTPQQEQLFTFLQQRALAGPGSQGPGLPSGAAEGKRGLFFNLPKKQKFNFGIPGREMITLRQFDRISADKKKETTEKALMIICNDIAFVCHQTPGETAGTYELFDKPTQRDEVKAEDYAKDEKGFVLKMGKNSHILIANSKEERQYWIQVITARANFIPTDKLGEKAAATAAAASS
jgi:hypothetical protein